MVTMEGIIKKLGFHPLEHDYFADHDGWRMYDDYNPFKGLSLEEIEFIGKAAHNNPKCLKHAD